MEQKQLETRANIQRRTNKQETRGSESVAERSDRTAKAQAEVNRRNNAANPSNTSGSTAAAAGLVAGGVAVPGASDAAKAPPPPRPAPPLGGFPPPPAYDDATKLPSSQKVGSRKGELGHFRRITHSLSLTEGEIPPLVSLFSPFTNNPRRKTMHKKRLYSARDTIRKPLTYKPTDKRRIQADINRRKGQIQGTVKRVPRAERRKAETEQMFERMRNPPPVTPPSPLSTPTIPQMNRSGQFFQQILPHQFKRQESIDSGFSDDASLIGLHKSYRAPLSV